MYRTTPHISPLSMNRGACGCPFFALSGYFRTFTSTFFGFRILNTIDFIVCLTLVLAVWNGWRQGFVVQICSLAAVAVGLWLASRYGTAAGAWLRLDDSVQAAGGFVAVLLAAILATAIAGRLLRRLFRFAGFGLLDVALGIAVCAIKYLLLLSVLFAALDKLDAGHKLVDERTLAASKCYEPLLRLSETLFPMLERAAEHLPQMQHDGLQNA